MVKKLMLLAAAIAAFAAFAVPASASAAEVLMEGNPLAEEVEESYSGPASFSNENGGVECENVTATINFENGTMGNVTAFQGDGCETIGALHALGCHVAAVVPTNLPWTVDVNATDLTITGVTIDNAFQPGCVIPGVGEIPGIAITGDVTVTPGAGGTLEHVTLEGTLSSSLGPVNVNGTLVGANPGTEFSLG
jgi:hypothetical protein